MELEGQIAVVTGAGRGIGRTIALEIAKNGAKVILCGRTEKYLLETADEISKTGGASEVLPLDVRDSVAVQDTVDKIIDKNERIDILVNNAGVTRDGLIMRMKDEDWDLVLDTNLKGAFHFSRAVLKGMMKKRSGKIVNISSVIGLTGNAGQSNYAASKAGLIGMTKSLAKEVASRGVRVNAVAPGFIETDMTDVLNDAVKEKILKEIPMGKMGSSEDVADLVLFLCSKRSQYITGQVITVDGGLVM